MRGMVQANEADVRRVGEGGAQEHNREGNRTLGTQVNRRKCSKTDKGRKWKIKTCHTQREPTK